MTFHKSFQRQGFTLIEMLIVVTVLVTLMTIAFRLSNIGSDAEARSKTITRLQKLENCLSGYYAAFGTYPPVPNHGSPNIYQSVDGNGIQEEQTNESLWNWNKLGEQAERAAWRQVRAACVCQPISCEFPFPSDGFFQRAIQSLSNQLKDMTNSSDMEFDTDSKKLLGAGFSGGTAGIIPDNKKNKVDWRNLQLFRFGLMSFLLPRYLVMMGGPEEFYQGDYKQWDVNNTLPCDPMSGSKFNNWNEVKNFADNQNNNASDYARVANIPSQAVTARWMPNLEKICTVNYPKSLFGVQLQGEDASRLNLDAYYRRDPDAGDKAYRAQGEFIYSSRGNNVDQYILDCVTVQDGWYSDFYYHSQIPYQSYNLWSAGRNGRTFPPWISREGLSSQANKCIGLWTEDDIGQMTH